MKTAIYAKRVLRVAKELAVLSVEDDDPDIRRLARRDARTLLDIARLLQWRRWKTARTKVAQCRSAIFVPKSVKRFLEGQQ